MRTKIGTVLILLGVLFLAGSLGLYLYNDREDRAAAKASQNLMPQLVEAIVQRTEEQASQTSPTAPGTGLPGEYAPPEAAVHPEERVMPIVQVDGYGYIGFLSIPSLELELPVMADWSYPQLRIAPCRYTGDCIRDELVIMAHNYDHHFGRLSQLREGDTVALTDMNAKTILYTVVALDVLHPQAVDEMTAGDYDLTLFTCTFGGKSRVTVRCMRTQEN
jgi:sortase A